MILKERETQRIGNKVVSFSTSGRCQTSNNQEGGAVTGRTDNSTTAGRIPALVCGPSTTANQPKSEESSPKHRSRRIYTPSHSTPLKTRTRSRRALVLVQLLPGLYEDQDVFSDHVTNTDLGAVREPGRRSKGHSQDQRGSWEVALAP